MVTPNDGITDGVAGMASVVIGNTAPTVTATTVTPAGTVYNDDELSCSATVTDPDETPTTTYEWAIGGAVVGWTSARQYLPRFFPSSLDPISHLT